MKFVLGCLLLCALLFAVAPAYPQQPQQQNWNDFFAPTARPVQPPGRPGRPVRPVPGDSGTSTTTAAPSGATTASPQYLACLQNCPTTSQYNPVCGSDAVDYHNQAKLDCAVFCGKNVAAVRSGTCLPLG